MCPKNKILLTIITAVLVPVFSQATNYDIYVDKDNTTRVEDGTQTNPYNTITEAITAVESNDSDNRKIYIAGGEYREQLVLSDKIELYGKGKNDTIIYGKNFAGNRFSYVIKMKNKTKIKNLQVRYGKTGVLINKDDKATIDNCKIKDFKNIGIDVEEGDRNDKDLFTVEDSKIYSGKGKALYIRSRKIELIDNEIYDNEEEGIDLRSKVEGKIKNNEIYDNKEGGIELEVRNTNLKITSNDIQDQGASGINLQYRGKNERGKIILKRNEIDDNDDWGIKCSLPSGGKPPVYYFRNSVTFLNNIIKNNNEGSSTELCHF